MTQLSTEAAELIEQVIFSVHMIYKGQDRALMELAHEEIASRLCDYVANLEQHAGVSKESSCQRN